MEKGSAPPPMTEDPSAPGAPRMEAPPSYEQSLREGAPPPGQYEYKAPLGAGGGAGGFVGAPQMAPPPTSNASQQPQQIVVQYVNAPNFGPRSVRMTCPQCQSQIQTATSSEPGPMAWIIAGVLCIIGLWPCACVPCCIEQLNCVTHKCPQCQTFLGRYKGGM
uniref:LITAF homolog n=1 Tax=Caligus clemensi TaxID=344056 RepID=C1C0C4_CALCM|nr:LITAF homolog [Caligus clemensi]